MNEKKINPDANEILKHSCSAYFILNDKGIIKYVSPTTPNLNIDKKNLINTYFYQLATKKNQNIIQETIQSIKKNPSYCPTFSFQTKHNKKNIWQATAKNVLKNKKINGILIFIHNVEELKKDTASKNTEQKRENHTKKIADKNNNLQKEIIKRKEIEEQFQENKSKYFLLINQANEGICVAQDNVLKFVNPKLSEMLGYTQEEMINKPFIYFIHPEDQKKVTQRYNQRLKGVKTPEQYVFRTLDKSGHVHWVQIHAARFSWNKKPATVNFLSEITEKIYVKRKFEILFDSIPLITAEIDVKTLTVKSVNEAFCKSVGIPYDQLIGKDIKKILPTKIFKKRFQSVKKAINENRIVKRTDQRKGRYFFTLYVPVESPSGNKRIFIIAQDITKIKLTEQKYQRLIDSSPDAIAEVDGESGKILTVNPAMAENFNASKDYLIGKDWKSVLPPKIYKNRYELGLKAIENNEIQFFEDERNGRYYQNIFVPFTVKDKTHNLQIISRDITNIKLAQKQLKENEEKFRTITTSAQDAIIIIDDQGKITFWNNSARRIFGYNETEVIGKKVHSLLMPKRYDSSVVRQGINNFEKHGEGPAIGKTQELQAMKKNGEIFPVELSLSSIRLQDKWHAVGIVRDITRRKRMEQALIQSKKNLEKRVQERTKTLEDALNRLKESEQKYRSLITVAPVGIAITDLKGNVIDMNPAMEKLTGYTTETIDFSKHYVNSKDRKKLHSQLKKQGHLHSYEIELIKKSGEHYIALIDVEPIKYKGKDVYLTVERDITTIKKAEQQLRDVHDYMQNVINSASEFIFTLDRNKQVTMWNNTATSTTGLSSSSVIGKKFSELSCFVNPQIINDYIKNIRSNYSLPDTELFIRSKSSKTFAFKISCSSIKGAGDATDGYLIVGQDVTLSKQSEGKFIPGSSYLLYKSQNDIQQESLILQVKTQDKSLLLITRGPSVFIHQRTGQMNIDIVYLDDHQNDKDHISSCDEVFSTVSSYVHSRDSAVVLLDRLDYLIMNHSFESVLSLIYRLTSLVDSAQAVLIIEVNPDTFTEKQLSLLKEELRLFKETDIKNISLEESLYQILSFIYNQNKRNVLVSYGKIGKEFNISKVTTGKRITQLKQKGLITISLKGRMKSIHITKKAEDLLKERS